MLQEKRKWLITIVLSVLALIVPFAIFAISTSEKTLDFKIHSQTEISKGSIPVKGLKITMNGEDIESIYAYRIKISNSGSVPILKYDFEKALSIYVSEDSKIYSIKKRHTYPENLSLNYKVENNRLLISPLLLNPGDEFLFDLYSSSSIYPKVDARIAGIPMINSTSPESERLRKDVITIILIFVLIIIYAKSIVLLLSKRTYKQGASNIFNNTLLTLTCSGSSVFLAVNQFGSEIKMFFFIFITIPVALGMYWGHHEEKEYQGQIFIIDKKKNTTR